MYDHFNSRTGPGLVFNYRKIIPDWFGNGGLRVKMLALPFSSKLEWGSYIVSIAKTTTKKIGSLNCFIKFLSAEVTLYLFKFTIWPCMEYCCHVWACAPSCYLDMLDRLQKWICRTVGPMLNVSLEPLGHQRYLANVSLFL